MNPPKPTELKRRLGNPGKRPLPKNTTAITPVVITRSVPEAATGHELLEQLLASAASAWIGETDQHLLRLLSDLWDERRTLREAADELDPAWMRSRYIPPVYTRLEQVEKRVVECLSMLGLDPLSRSRLGVAEVKVRRARK